MDPDSWLARHPPQDGSWWPAYGAWLAEHSAPPAPPPAMGAPDARYPPLCPAPGLYIHQT